MSAVLMVRAKPARHRAGVIAMVTAHAAWLRERQLRVPDDVAATLASQLGEAEWPVWVLEDEGTVLGCTTVLEECPAWAYTDAERAESSYFLASTWTRPTDGARLGHVIARWALDHAARTSRSHVRRGAFHARLADYYCREQGLRLLREVERRGRTAYIMSRPAEQQPDLPVLTLTAPTE
ncbi:hypothetical protein ABZ914_10780 [Spirillospora sp. NPDC046719]